MNIKSSARNALYGMVFSSLFGLLFLIVLVLYIKDRTDNNEDLSVFSSETVLADSNLNSPIVEVLPIENINKITYNNSDLQLPSGYTINSRFASSETSGMQCGDGSTNCEVYEIISENSSDVFYISLNQNLNAAETLGQIEDREGVSYEVLEMVVTGEELIRQINTCINQSFCISSGILFLNDMSTNQSQVESFKKFINLL